MVLALECYGDSTYWGLVSILASSIFWSENESLQRKKTEEHWNIWHRFKTAYGDDGLFEVKRVRGWEDVCKVADRDFRIWKKLI